MFAIEQLMKLLKRSWYVEVCVYFLSAVRNSRMAAGNMSNMKGSKSGLETSAMMKLTGKTGDETEITGLKDYNVFLFILSLRIINGKYRNIPVTPSSLLSNMPLS